MNTMTKSSWVLRGTGVLAAVGMLAAAGVAYATVPTFSQTSFTVGAGQSTVITSTNGVQVYLEGNSTPTDVSVLTSGTQATLMGLAPGSSNVTLCGVGTASDCTNILVTVQTGSVNTSALSFSQNNLSLPVSSSQSVTVSGGSGTYSISGNSNTNAVSASLASNVLTISGFAAGTATITVCDTSSNCGTLSVAVGSTNTSSGSAISFSQNNFSLVTGTNQTVIISGGNGAYSVNNNSNPSDVATSLSGNGITVYASAAGNATITVCDTSSNCGTLSVAVNNSSVNQVVTFSVASPTLAVGASLSVALSGGPAGYVVLSNSNPNVVQASITGGNTLALYGEAAGTDSLAVCATGGGCSALSVTVQGTTTTPTPVTAPTPVTTVPTPGTGTVTPNATLLAEIQTLQTAMASVLAQIQSMETTLNQLTAQVNAGSGSTVSAGAASSGASYDFTELLTAGSEDAQVTALQNRLTTLGFYSGPITGFYGSLTEQAVTKYQTSHGIEATGYVGPATRAVLNAGE